MNAIAAAMITFAALALGTGTAHADPAFNSDERGYLHELHNDGINVKDDAAAVKEGHNICTMLEGGMSRDVAMNALLSGVPDLGMKNARNIVDASATYLCPMSGQ